MNKIFNRNITGIANYFLDHICPPFLRDCKWFMRPIIWVAYGNTTNAVLDFKDKYPFMSESDLSKYYDLIKNAPINKRESDLNKGCMRLILSEIDGDTILDACCGRGFLVRKIEEKFQGAKVSGLDWVKPDGAGNNFIEGNITALPFENKSFDTVICTHALEHIKNYKKAIGELVRVTKKKLIIVLPKQREYRYTPDLHVHFLPYMYRFKEFIGIEEAKYFEVDGDFVCIINYD